MKKFIQLLVVAIVVSTGNIYAQSGVYAGDALRFSRTDYGSTARFKGLGNAQISLGGDISSIGGNPAGLGMFTRSEFSITPEFNNVKSDATYLGQSTKSTKNRLNLNQAAAVWYNPVVKPKGADLNKGVVSVVWGIGYNRNNDFGGEFNYNGKNTNSSMADDFAQQANAYGLADVSNMAFKSYLVDEVGNNDFAPATSQTNMQGNSEYRTGSTSELNFSGAINLSNKLYLGASIGFVSVNYNNDRLYNETGTIIDNSGLAASGFQYDPNPYVGDNYNMVYRSNQNTDGSGVNAKLGLIYKPINSVRLGATFQTPTWMHVEETFDQVVDVDFSQGGSNVGAVRNDVNYSDFNYNLRTPYKGSLGASVILGKNALITADVDYVDYATTKLSVSDGFRDILNENNTYVKQNYTDAINYRFGAEYRIDKFSLRAGYGVNGTPYKFDDDNLSEIKYYSGGIGYRVSQYYVDLAYQRTETNNTYTPYYLNDEDAIPVATSKIARNNVFLTVGVRF